MRDTDSADSEFHPATPDPIGSSNGTGTGGRAAKDVSTSSAADEPDFLAQLAQAMQATAGTERARAIADIERRRAAHTALIQERRDAEIARMRELAADDRKGIDAWVEAEQRRIQAEREGRTKELEDDLRRSLEEHAQQVDRQVAAAEKAVRAHRAEVDAFFASLGTESDPVRIAQLAARRPAFPDLEAASAGANPTAEPASTRVPAEPATPDPATDGAERRSSPARSEAKAEPPKSATSSEPTKRKLAPIEFRMSSPTVASPSVTEAPSARVPAADPEPPVVGVMDPIMRLGLLSSSDDPAHTAAPELLAPTPALAASLASGRKPAVVTPLAARTSTRPAEPAAPPPTTSLNPMSWLRRGNDHKNEG